jgi:GTP pyrophosphokinase
VASRTGSIKDFIAIPRPNLYQSLHTSVIGPQGQPFEVQIRTEEMHRIAEEGIAAHWKYKEGRKGPAGDDQRIAWLRQLVEWQRDMQDPGEFMSTPQSGPVPGGRSTPSRRAAALSYSRATPPQSTSPTPSTPTSATLAWGLRSTAVSCR